MISTSKGIEKGTMLLIYSGKRQGQTGGGGRLFFISIQATGEGRRGGRSGFKSLNSGGFEEISRLEKKPLAEV